ncbi:MAG: Hsp20/alpha crystallin family protein [Thermodesulfobacteriota bacterium]|nr:Hsp20/alpha crystallin family protein [Thermodesulfobacteriota bacterium]
METKEMKVRGRSEVTGPEQTTAGPTFVPSVDIFETETVITLMADLPGVKPADIDIDLRDDVLTLAGNITPVESENETRLLVEYETGRYYRQFTLSDIIDQKAIEAEMTDGVLRLILPKAEKAQPRSIKVTTS